MKAMIGFKLVAALLLLMCSEWGYSNESVKFENFKLINQSELRNVYGNNSIGLSIIDFQEDNPLYQEILNELNGHYERIGQRQTDRIINSNNGFYIGGLNNIGFRWGKDFFDFAIEVRRNVAPDLFDDKRWIVTDEFDITIDASKVISNLVDRNIIDISQTQYGAFAGVQFKRTYKYVHFANSYNEGLIYHFDKLFLAFAKFRGREWLMMEPYEFLQKQDYLSASAGGFGTIPIYGNGGVNLSASVGAMVKFDLLAKTDIQALGPDDNPREEERFRLSYEKKKGLSAGLSASVQIDFLNLLRMTLLSYDFTYRYEQSSKYYLSFYESDIEALMYDSDLYREVRKLLWHRTPNLDILKYNINSFENRESQIMKSKYMILILGGIRDQKTEHIEIIKDNKIKTFFRHNFYKIRFVQNVFSRLFSDLLGSLFRLPVAINNTASESKTVRVEYDHEENLIKSKEDLDVEKGYKLSVKFTTDYFASKTKGWSKKKYKMDTIKLLESYSGVDPSVVRLLESDHLHGPVKIHYNWQLGKEAVWYFNGLSSIQKYNYIDEACQVHTKKKWWDFRNLFNFCKWKLKKEFEKYEMELKHTNYTGKLYRDCDKRMKKRYWWSKRKRFFMTRKCMELSSKISKDEINHKIPLWRFKSFVQTLYEKSKNKIDIYNFFGIQHSFLYGNFQAQTESGLPFLTNYNEGKFKDLGVVDTWKQDSNLRTPASINID
ncbi:MAG: hypothetical protein KC493_15420 [Bacteriovoracaceae bacterium]|nr:hypothetical protein [Bacteriovoracaceae bacterium]